MKRARKPYSAAQPLSAEGADEIEELSADADGIEELSAEAEQEAEEQN